jgi:hypothetical protein
MTEKLTFDKLEQLIHKNGHRFDLQNGLFYCYILDSVNEIYLDIPNIYHIDGKSNWLTVKIKK